MCECVLNLRHKALFCSLYEIEKRIRGYFSSPENVVEKYSTNIEVKVNERVEVK